MSIFSAIGTGLSKAASFLLTVFTKTDKVVKMFEGLTPQVQAAMLATFFDVTKALTSGAAAAGAASTGNIPSAFTLSETTLTLLEQVKSDVVADVADIKADLTALGILG